jgi:type II secretory pathway pseudopilin PulG
VKKTWKVFADRYYFRVPNPKARAFTLLELLLVMVILIVLAGIVWPNLGRTTSRAKLEHSVRQLAELMKLGRAEAMSTGKSYRCRFDVGGMKAMIEEETNPQKQPGVYETIPAGWGQVDLGADNIKCLSILFDPWESQLKEEEAKILEPENEAEKNGLGPPIMFYPDGTSDTVSILLGDQNDRNFTLKINGLTGHIQIEDGNTQDVQQKKKEANENPG